MNTWQQLPLSIAAASRHAQQVAMLRRLNGAGCKAARSNRTFGFAHDEMQTDSPRTE
jgi:hypothetical protein